MTAMPGRRSDYLYPVAFTPLIRPHTNSRRNTPAKANRDDMPSLPGAACIGEDTELWFSDSSEDRTKVLAICESCPYTGGHGACATSARTATSPKVLDGIWGGVDMSVKENRVKPLMCDGPGCHKAATGRRKYCSDRCYYAACRARKKAREARKLAEWEASVAAWRRQQLDNAVTGWDAE